jgi:DNA gyrase/topoisomerase IV subunit B
MTFQIKTKDLFNETDITGRFNDLQNYLISVDLNGENYSVCEYYTDDCKVTLQQNGDDWFIEIKKKIRRGKFKKIIKKTQVNSLKFNYHLKILEPNPEFNNINLAGEFNGFPSLERNEILSIGFDKSNITSPFNTSISANSKFEKNLPQHIFKNVCLVN